ncbi:hypothetical protein ACFL1Z_09490 [Thermodesulfobacteriota bacterium]
MKFNANRFKKLSFVLGGRIFIFALIARGVFHRIPTPLDQWLSNEI